MFASSRLLMGCAVVFLFTGSTLLAEKKAVVPNRNWVAVVNDETLKKHAPKSGVILDAKAFEKLWKAWRKDEKVPTINFKKEFVLVTLASGPNKPTVSASLEDGNLKILSLQTLIGGNGFGYSLATFDRKGVKKLNGKDFPKE
jgi:hypothetical protein